MGKYVIASAPDWHFGAFEAERLYEESSIFRHELESLEKLDIIVIPGDLFDYKLSANSSHMKYALKFIMDIMKIAESKNAKVRLIQGTESHDNDQLALFKIINDFMDTIDFKIIHTVEKEQIFHDLKVLYIPEEYIDNMEEYYKEYFEEEYDFIFGHGLVDKASFIASIQESEGTRPKAPIFKVDELSSITKGAIYFGHIHRSLVYDKFRYVGSQSRWSHGEEEPKGFYLTTYDTETLEMNERFVENILARRYDTIKIFDDSPVFKERPHILVTNLLDFANNHIKDYLRLEIHIPEDYPDPHLLNSLLQETFNKNKKIKLKILNTLKEKSAAKVKERVDELMEKYHFVFNRQTDIPTKVAEFVKLKYGRDIPIEKMRKYLQMED